jgi:hypothetical protein
MKRNNVVFVQDGPLLLIYDVSILMKASLPEVSPMMKLKDQASGRVYSKELA